MNDIKYINGHVVIENMPAELLHESESEVDHRSAIRVSLYSPNSKVVNGDACFYVGEDCCRHRGGDGKDARYDIILIDDAYPVFCDMINPANNEQVRVVIDDYVGSDVICKMANMARDRHDDPSLVDRPVKKSVFKNKGSRADEPIISLSESPSGKKSMTSDVLFDYK